MIKRYHHGPVAIHADPDFEESPDGDVVLWADHEADRAALVKELKEARAALDTVTDAFRKSTDEWSGQAQTDRAEVALLTEKLAAAERDASVAGKMARDLKVAEQKLAAAEDRVRHECSVSRAAEARCRELEGKDECAGLLLLEELKMRRELESELAQLRERVAKLIRRMAGQGSHHLMIDDLEEALRGPK